MVDSVEVLWEAVKAQCCADPKNATKVVMMTKAEFVKAVEAAVSNLEDAAFERGQRNILESQS